MASSSFCQLGVAVVALSLALLAGVAGGGHTYNPSIFFA
jgi:hypothetical protein